MAQPLTKGFDNPPIDSASLFRALLAALSRPGQIATPAGLPEPPQGLNDTAFAAALTLCDADTSVWLHPDCATPAAIQAMRFHTGAPLVDGPGTADFALAPLAACADLLPVLKPGTPEYPDRSATLIALCDAIGSGGGPALTGPGIETDTRIDIGAGAGPFWQVFAAVNGHFPLGIEVILAAPGQIAAAPRSTRIGD